LPVVQRKTSDRLGRESRKSHFGITVINTSNSGGCKQKV
jgi:hypothetical protein